MSFRIRLVLGFVLAVSSLPAPVNTSAVCGGTYYSNNAPPPSIRVYITSTGQVVSYDFKYYVKNVLPVEWFTWWPQNSLRAGAIAAKDYGWYFVNNGPWLHPNGLCYDVDDTTYYQVFQPGSAVPATDLAVDATWNWLTRRSGGIFRAEYRADPRGCGGWGGGTTMSQWGTYDCANAGYGWHQIVTTYYYPNVTYAQTLLTYSWYLRYSNSTGGASVSFTYGIPGDIPVVGDWIGQGISTPGIFRDGGWYLRNSNTTGGADISFNYGIAGDVPIVGDWTGQGLKTPGVFRNGYWYLRNSNSTGTADISFQFGQYGDIPVVGYWSGRINPSTGFLIDTIGVIRNGYFYLRNSDTTGSADLTFSCANAGDTPVVGDWIGQALRTPGVFADSYWNERNSNTSGPPDTTFGLRVAM